MVHSSPPLRNIAMAKSNQRLDIFIGEVTSGEPSPKATTAEEIEERVWSGEIAEIDQATYRFYMNDNAGPPRMMMDDWFVFSDARTVEQPGILFWQDGERYYARH